MKRTIAVIVALTASIACLTPMAHADHDLSRSIRREYDLHRKELDRSFRAEIEAVRCEFQRNRDLLLAERECVIHSHCANRGDEIRAISWQLSSLLREYGRNLGNLARVVADHHEELRERRDLALREARCAKSAAAFAQPVADLEPCSCHGRGYPRCHAHNADVGFQRRVGFDWTGLVVNLLAQRSNR